MTILPASISDADSGITQSSYASAIHVLFDTCQRILNQHRADNPDIYRLVDLKKQQAVTSKQSVSPIDSNPVIPAPEPKTQSFIFSTPHYEVQSLERKCESVTMKSDKKYLPLMRMLFHVHKLIIVSARIPHGRMKKTFDRMSLRHRFEHGEACYHH